MLLGPVSQRDRSTRLGHGTSDDAAAIAVDTSIRSQNDDRRAPAPKMFERFNAVARRAIVLAQEQARAFNSDHVGTEHLLLSLVYEDTGVAA